MNNAIIMLDFFEPVDRFVHCPATDKQGDKEDNYHNLNCFYPSIPTRVPLKI